MQSWESLRRGGGGQRSSPVILVLHSKGGNHCKARGGIVPGIGGRRIEPRWRMKGFFHSGLPAGQVGLDQNDCGSHVIAADAHGFGRVAGKAGVQELTGYLRRHHGLAQPLPHEIHHLLQCTPLHLSTVHLEESRCSAATPPPYLWRGGVMQCHEGDSPGEMKA
jgi:hypothetical protein